MKCGIVECWEYNSGVGIGGITYDNNCQKKKDISKCNIYVKIKNLKCCGNCSHYKIGLDKCMDANVYMDFNDSCDNWKYDELNFKDRSEE